jgi:hypothetical protein
MAEERIWTAALLVIGDEMLSGRKTCGAYVSPRSGSYRTGWSGAARR